MKSVKIILILVVGVILFMQLQCSRSKEDIRRETKPGEPYAGLKCSIRPLKDSIKRGEDIKFIFTLQNVSDEVIHLPKTEIRQGHISSGLWIAMTGEKGERFLQLTIHFPIFIVGKTLEDRTAITEIPPREKVEIPMGYNGSLGKPTVRLWSGIVIDPEMVPETYDGWTGSIASNVIEVDIVE